jgi:hypothetical protein
MLHWSFLRVGLALFLSFSAGDLGRAVDEFSSWAAEAVSHYASDNTTPDQDSGTPPEEEPGEEDDEGSEMDPNG